MISLHPKFCMISDVIFFALIIICSIVQLVRGCVSQRFLMPEREALTVICLILFWIAIHQLRPNCSLNTSVNTHV